MQESSDPNKGYVAPRKLLDLVHAFSPDNKNSGTPILDQVETDQILQNVPATPQGAKKDKHKYQVRRLAKVDTAAIDFVTLDGNAFYEPHAHEQSNSKIFINEGFGYLLLSTQQEDEVWHPYKPGDSFYVSCRTFHGFFTASVTHFVSVNDPEIIDAATRAVDLKFRSPRQSSD